MTNQESLNYKGKRQLHPRAVWMFILDRIIGWFIVGVALSSTYIIVDLSIHNRNNIFDFPVIKFLVLTAIVFIIEIIVIYFIAKLTYNFYRFELTDIEYKQEHGILTKSYVSIPYERIQNINISRGIIDRILGLSNIGIQTAGSNFGSEGFLYGLGVKEAEELKIKLIEMSKIAKDLS